MARIPIHDDGVPIACTATGVARDERARALERLRADLCAVERTVEGLLVRFPATPTTEAQVRRFTLEEQACCAFFGFALTAAAGTLLLRWEGPPAASPIFDGLHAFLAGDGPVSALAGLL